MTLDDTRNSTAQTAVTSPKQTLLRLDNAQKHYPLGARLPWSWQSQTVKAVDGISFDITPGETVSIVGESGCGKTTTSKMILLLEKPTSGRILFEGKDINDLQGDELKWYRKSVQAVFQDPSSSLSPRMRIRSIVAEPIRANLKIGRREQWKRVDELLLAVGLDPSVAKNFPHELSGGMRQRLAVARALALHPSLIILDEPVSALDVSIRAQIMNLLKDLQDQYGIAYLLVAHNLATVRYLSHRVVAMYAGQIVEQGDSVEVFSNPAHPYTQALISAATPIRPGEDQESIVLSGEVPSPINPPLGCRFHPRCRFAIERCKREVPLLQEQAPGHLAACHLL